MKKDKIGIMGGTFDPIHLGHLVIANEVLDQYNMDKIIFIPVGNPPHKDTPNASSFHRYIMTSMATMTNDKFLVSDIEIKRSEKSYTINTVKELINIYKNADFYFITGADSILELPKWRDYEDLLKLCSFIAVNRPGYVEVENKINEIKDQYKCKIEMLNVPMLQISSTDIRKRIKNNLSTKYLLTEMVEHYIIKNNLYQENKISE